MIDAKQFKDSIPLELAERKQWVVANEKKVPYKPTDPWTEASHSSPEHWADLDTAIANARPYLGYVFSSQDPYIGIDLDKTETGTLTEEVVAFHRQILEDFKDCYVERSISGTGYHIIVKGKINTDLSGTKNTLNSIEIYQHSRYFTVSADVLNNPTEIPDRSELTEALFDRLSSGRTKNAVLVDIPATESDAELIAKMQKASNWASSIEPLWKEPVKPDDEDKSERDNALMSHLYFYTKNKDQALRLFKMSARAEALARKPKPDYYLSHTFDAIMANDPSLKGEAAIANFVPTLAAPTKSATAFDFVAAPKPSAERDAGAQGSFPPGIMGDIARYIYEQAPRPSVEFSTACALAAVAGIAARAYTFERSTLNLYICMVGLSATGKSSHVRGIKNLYGSVADPMLKQAGYRHLGANRIASASGLLTVLGEQPCQLAPIGEFGFQLQKMCSAKASTLDQEIKGVLLDLFSTSYVQASNNKAKDNRSASIEAPAFSFIGDSTPSALFEQLSISEIEEGLINRITFVDLGERVPDKRGRRMRSYVPVPENLKSLIADLINASVQRNGSEDRESVDVALSEAAGDLIDGYDEAIERLIQSRDTSEVVRNLIARKVEKAARIAALLAVADNRHAPEITEAHMQYAIDYTEADVQSVLEKYQEGIIGDDNLRRVNLFRARLGKYIAEWPLKGYKTPKTWHENGVFDKPLFDGMIMSKAFKDVRQRPAQLLEQVLDHEIDRGNIQPIVDNSAYGKTSQAKLYKVVETSIMLDSYSRSIGYK